MTSQSVRQWRIRPTVWSINVFEMKTQIMDARETVHSRDNLTTEIWIHLPPELWESLGLSPHSSLLQIKSSSRENGDWKICVQYHTFFYQLSQIFKVNTAVSCL